MVHARGLVGARHRENQDVGARHGRSNDAVDRLDGVDFVHGSEALVMSGLLSITRRGRHRAVQEEDDDAQGNGRGEVKR